LSGSGPAGSFENQASPTGPDPLNSQSHFKASERGGSGGAEAAWVTKAAAPPDPPRSRSRSKGDLTEGGGQFEHDAFVDCGEGVDWGVVVGQLPKAFDHSGHQNLRG